MEKKDKFNKSVSVLFLLLAIFGIFLVENSSYSPSNLAANLPEELLLTKKDTPPSFIKIDTNDVLLDIENRISPDFKIPPGLEERVSFWLEIYSVYPSDKKVIHHVDYPWIKYDVFDISEILARPAKFNWINPEKAEKETQKRMAYIKNKLMGLASKLKKNKIKTKEQIAEIKASLNLDSEEAKYLELLQDLPGDMIKKIRAASSRMRIQTGQKDHFQNGLGIANRYLPHMEKIFIDHGLPPEISRLPLVESSFNKQATSKVGAAGLWQFMEGTGKKFLVVNDFIDERRSPFKSSEAAAELIKENYKILSKSWPLAITAWNHGPGGLRKAMKSLKTKDIATIIKYFESKQFSFASENFYSEFLAALYVEKYSDKIFDSINLQPTLVYDSYRLTQRIKPSKIFKAINLSAADFIDLNPDLIRAVKFNLTLPKGLIIFVHPDKVSELTKLANQKWKARDEI
ncbi:MAG: lytic transglycosylase domain-containing protein [Bdellovibrionaceae bacterium]|nr:lytic transglycosylase domain-containing protein [Pseudobdellovibrionaceae bacterium]